MKSNDAARALAHSGDVVLVNEEIAPARGPSAAHALLRLPLYYKLIIANGVITLAAVLACAALVTRAVRANPVASTRVDVWVIMGVAAAIGMIVNSIVVRIALSPVRNLERAAEAVRAGDDTVRAVEGPVSDAATADVVTVFNTMLDSLATYRRRLRKIAIRAVDAGETERSRLSRELHDGVAQGLAAVLVQLRIAQRSATPECVEQLAAVSGQIATAINELRALAQSLRPPALDMIGVSAALKSYVRQLGTTTGLHTELTTVGIDNVLPNESELALYRIVQDALRNVVEHAQTKQAVVEVARVGPNVVATIADNGRGFNVAHAMSNGALGLFGMHERALYVGGSVEIKSSPGQGTVVQVSIPVSEEPHE